ncbi:helix-turn-helix domain-containing protein [Rhizomonospora bruguierae]|uniref:helix-turn-helix domain-containing protein n=1 Tax=Rhizomonospora bruguierae TaxID=1581705 RepID=UPI001BCC902C|nr:helix-turn-helix domain-containing protein [Micromonospora sp. NBRC 107566]
MPRRFVDPDFPARLRHHRQRRGLSLRDLAALTYYGKSYLGELEAGRKDPTVKSAQRLDDALDAGGELAAMVTPGAPGPELAARLDDELGADGRLAAMVRPAPDEPSADEDELAALELARRVEASDVGAETLARIEAAVDELAMAYAGTPPKLLLPRVRHHLAYVGRLVDAHKTLAQQRRLLTSGGWLSLLAATLHIDLRQRAAANANLTTAWQLAEHSAHGEVAAWVLETQAWDALTDGAYQCAVELSQRAQAIAPRGSSALIQATAQEGRAWARMGDAANTGAALRRVARMVSPLPVPDQPEHHYRYDPAKEVSYTATTLSWVGDPAAERYARGAVTELEAARDGVRRPRRIASARLDLGLALLAAGRPDEAGAEAQTAITSGRVVPSNWWRATEVVRGVERAGIREATELRDAYETYRPEPTAG